MGAATILLGVPGAVVAAQVRRARTGQTLTSPGYRVDAVIDPPDGSAGRTAEGSAGRTAEGSPPQGPPLRIAMLGDSIVEGIGAELVEQCLPVQTAAQLAQRTGRQVRVRGHGRASAKTRDVLAIQVNRLHQHVRDGAVFDLVVLVVGTNDATWGVPPWVHARQLRQLIDEAHAITGVPVVATGLPQLDAAPLLPSPLREVAKGLGDAMHAVQLRVARAHPHGRAVDVRSHLGDVFFRRGMELFASDGYHPNAEGYALIGAALAAGLTDLLAAEGIAAPLAS